MTPSESIRGLNYVFVKMPEIAIYFCSNATKSILSHIKH